MSRVDVQGTVGGVGFELVQGDITAQDDIDAVVNAANAQLMPGGGVAGAIHSAAGPQLAAECRPLAPIQPGTCVRTGGHGLPNSHVLHCLGPVYGVDKPEDELLASCYRQAVELAEQHGARSVAFPALSTGAFGYPLSAAAVVAIDAVVDVAPKLHTVRLARFVLFDARALRAHEDAFARRLP